MLTYYYYHILKSYFEIKVSRKVGRVLTSNGVNFVSLADTFTVQVSNLLKLCLERKTKQLNEPGNYRELRETGPRKTKFTLFSFNHKLNNLIKSALK